MRSIDSTTTSANKPHIDVAEKFRKLSLMKETDLYPPVKEYLESHGYEVRAEVKNCDLVATREDELVVVELKTSANIQLLIQATDRQRISDSVYVAIPAPQKRRTKQWRGITHVLRRLELGLMTVAMDSPSKRVQIEFDPVPFQKRKPSHRRRAVIKEIADRSGDYNVGGTHRQKLMTAYREKAILVACCLAENGPMSPKELRNLGTGPKTLGILSNNHYGWFQRVARGVYQITDKGVSELEKYPEITAQSREFLAEHAKDV